MLLIALGVTKIILIYLLQKYVSQNRVRSRQKARLTQELPDGTGSTQLLSTAPLHSPSGRTDSTRRSPRQSAGRLLAFLSRTPARWRSRQLMHPERVWRPRHEDLVVIFYPFLDRLHLGRGSLLRRGHGCKGGQNDNC